MFNWIREILKCTDLTAIQPILLENNTLNMFGLFLWSLQKVRDLIFTLLILLLLLVITRALVTIFGWEIYWYVGCHSDWWSHWQEWSINKSSNNSGSDLSSLLSFCEVNCSYFDPPSPLLQESRLDYDDYTVIRLSHILSINTWLVLTVLSSHLCWQMCAVLKVAIRRTKRTFLIFVNAFIDILYQLMIFDFVNTMYGMDLPLYQLQLFISVPLVTMVLHSSIQWFFFVNNKKAKFRYFSPETKNHVGKNGFFNVIITIHTLCMLPVIILKSDRHKRLQFGLQIFLSVSELVIRIFMLKKHYRLWHTFPDQQDQPSDTGQNQQHRNKSKDITTSYHTPAQQECNYDSEKTGLVVSDPSGDDRAAVGKTDNTGWVQTLQAFVIVGVCLFIPNMIILLIVIFVNVVY